MASLPEHKIGIQGLCQLTAASIEARSMITLLHHSIHKSDMQYKQLMDFLLSLSQTEKYGIEYFLFFTSDIIYITKIIYNLKPTSELGMRRGAQEQRLEDGKTSYLVWKKFGDENCLRTNMMQGPTVKKCKSRSSLMSQQSLSPHIYCIYIYYMCTSVCASVC
jgi:hypothetical protein